MDKKIEDILQDLYLIDESLRSQEKELVVIVEELLKAKPETKLDRDFVLKLREELLAKAAQSRKIENVVPGIAAMMRAFVLAKPYAAFASIVVLIGITTGAYYLGLMSGGVGVPAQPVEQAARFGAEITKIADNAFGTLGLSPESKGGMAMRPQSGGGGLGGGSATAPAAMPMMEGGVVDGKMIAPEIWNFAYTYAGDDVELADVKGSVYRKKMEKLDGGSLSRILASFDLRSFDASKLSNVKVNNLSLVEDREYGYSLSFDFWSGNVAIGTNWERWPQVAYECRDEACFNAYRLKLSDVPADAEVVAAADRFLKEYGVDMAGYGAGEIQKDFMQPMPLISQTEIYVPDRVSVLYPLILDGKQVFEPYGGKTGMTVDFDVRNKRIAGAYYSFLKKYESSSYDLVTDFAKIKDVALRGGLTGNYENQNPTKIIEVKLGTPSRELSKIYNFNPATNMNEELIVPSLVFPVLNQKETGIYQKHIIVPLVTGLNGAQGGAVGGSVPVMIQKSL